MDGEAAILQCRGFCRGWVLVGMRATGMGGAAGEGKALSMTEREGSALLLSVAAGTIEGSLHSTGKEAKGC